MSQSKTQTAEKSAASTTTNHSAPESSVNGSQTASEPKTEAFPQQDSLSSASGSTKPDSTSLAGPDALPEPLTTAEEPFEDDPNAIDMETFRQILDLDDEDVTYEFSREMVSAYFKQANETFGNMDTAIKATDLAKLSSLGHFLKGSSATLGVSKVQTSCEKIQNYGVLRDGDANKDITKEDALERITSLLVQTKREYGSAEKWLRNWYAEQGISVELDVLE